MFFTDGEGGEHTQVHAEEDEIKPLDDLEFTDEYADPILSLIDDTQLNEEILEEESQLDDLSIDNKDLDLMMAQ